MQVEVHIRVEVDEDDPDQSIFEQIEDGLIMGFFKSEIVGWGRVSE